jgi:hypothetical protein
LLHPKGESREPVPGLRLSSRNRPDDHERLLSARYRIGEWRIGLIDGKILPAREKSQERPSLERDLVAHRPAQHRILVLERVEDRSLRHRASDLERYFLVYAGERAQVGRKFDTNHCSV